MLQDGYLSVLEARNREEFLGEVVRFTKRLGFETKSTNSGETALQILEGPERASISLVLLDLVMPGMDGRQLAQRIQTMKPAARVLYMSGYPADVIAQRGVLERDTAFLAKPFTRAVLGTKVHEVLTAPPPPG